MAGSVVDHGRSWPVMATVMVDHDRVRGRPWFMHLLSFMAAFMADHGRTWIRSWSTMVDHSRPRSVTVDHGRVRGRPWSPMAGYGCGHVLCNYLSLLFVVHGRDHGRPYTRSWAAMLTVIVASMMIGHDRVHDRLWPCPWPSMVGHARGHGRPCTRSWTRP